MLAGFPAVRTELELPPTPESPGRTLPFIVVDRLEEVIDAEALLRVESTPDPPYWTLVWIGARALAAEMLACPPPPTSRVLDLGCGLGISGVAAGLAGAHVLFADLAEPCLAFAAANARLHGLTSFETRRVDFTRDRLATTFDVILAADVVYDPAAYGPLADFLEGHLAPGGLILVTESLRADARVFLQRMAQRGFRDHTRATWLDEDGRRERTWLHRLEHDPT